jgi:hypothetical protein
VSLLSERPETVLATLQASSAATYGAERAEDPLLRSMLEITANALARVASARLEPVDVEPTLGSHG